MNIEEAIDRIKRIIKITYTKEFATFELMYQDTDAIETLLSAYEKEKEKNKELEVKLLVEHTDNLYNKEEASEEMIPRYKIKAKIEEIGDGTYDAKIVLQNLLKEN